MLAAVVIAALTAVNIASLALLDRALARHASERAAHREELAALAQRIQAPGEAVFAHATRDTAAVAPPRVRFDDDEDYWAATETKEQLAERTLREELRSRLAAGSGD